MPRFIRMLMGSIVVFVACGTAAEAAELTVLSATAMRNVVRIIPAKFEGATGHKLSITYGEQGAILKRIEEGQTADVLILPVEAMQRLIEKGKVAADTVAVFARSSLVIAVRKGAPKPDISSPDALRRTLSAAKSLSYIDAARGGGAGAIHFAQVLDRLGIAQEVKAKRVAPTSSKSVHVLVATGEAEIGVNQVQLLSQYSDVEVVGPLPGELQGTLVYAAAVLNGTTDATASKALIAFLRSSDVTSVIKSYGMEPGSK